MAVCTPDGEERRKLFWSTQPDACGTVRSPCSGNDCGIPGLSYTETVEGATVDTTDWLRGLVINMLMTDGREPDRPCGHRPGAQGGHWSESYIEDGPASVGTLVRNFDTAPRVRDNVNLVVANARNTLQRLVDRGVAQSVEVSGDYTGGAKMTLNVVVNGQNINQARVGLSGDRLANQWVWN